MPTAGHILQTKQDLGAEVFSIAPTDTVLDAVRFMNEKHIGAVVVLRSETVVGIFTERDLMCRVVAEGGDPASTKVADVMTSKVYCATSKTSGDELRTLMRERRIRHVPVVDNGQLVGVLSLGDLNVAREQVQNETIQFLEQFMYRP